MYFVDMGYTSVHSYIRSACFYRWLIAGLVNVENKETGCGIAGMHAYPYISSSSHSMIWGSCICYCVTHN